MFIRNLPVAIGLTVLIGGAFFAANIFRNIHRPAEGNAYFMLPASQLEKGIVGFIIGTIYFFGMMLITYVIGNLLGTGLNNLLAQIPFFSDILPLFHTSDLHWTAFENFFISSNFETANIRHSLTALIPNSSFLLFVLFFIQIQSFYLLGSIYFKRSQVWKTLLAWSIIQILLLIFTIVELNIFTGRTEIAYHSFDQIERWLTIVINGGFGFIFYVLPHIIWIISYLRLTEKQV
jgi:hypothetical protein